MQNAAVTEEVGSTAEVSIYLLGKEETDVLHKPPSFLSL